VSSSPAPAPGKQEPAPGKQEPAPGKQEPAAGKQEPGPDDNALVEARPRPALDLVLRIAGVVISVVAAFFSGVLEVFGTQLRIGGIPIGVSILAAVIVNPAIAWFAYTSVARRWALAPPWIVWTAFMLIATGYRTREGDYLVAGDDWIALATVLLGSLAFAGYAYRMILNRPATR
jgi:hypothetical protein